MEIKDTNSPGPTENWGDQFALATRFIYVVCNKQIDSITTAALLCVPDVIITHKMVNMFWAPVGHQTPRPMLSRLRAHRSVSCGERVLKELTMGREPGWRQWCKNCDESLGPGSQQRLGSDSEEWDSPVGGITYTIIVLISDKGTRDQRDWASYSRSHCLVVVLTIFHLRLLKCKGLCTTHHTILSLSLNIVTYFNSPLNHHLIHSLGSTSSFIR